MHVVIVPVESSSGAFTVCNGGGSLLSMEGRRDSWRDGGDESRLLGPKVRSDPSFPISRYMTELSR